MDIVEMVLTGRVNKGLVSLIQQAGGQAVGICGKDSNLLVARQMVEKNIGFVGEVTKVRDTPLIPWLHFSRCTCTGEVTPENVFSNATKECCSDQSIQQLISCDACHVCFSFQS